MARVKHRMTLTDLYKKSDLNAHHEWKEVKEIWDIFVELLVDDMLKNGTCYKIPFNLGSLQIRKRKSGRKTIDFYNTKKYDSTIYNSNKHSDGYYAFLFWDTARPHCQLVCKNIYKLKFVRKNNRMLAKQIKSNNSILKYFEID